MSRPGPITTPTFTAFPKPDGSKRRAKRTHAGRRLERIEKAKVRQRDRCCRVPWCSTPTDRLTVAHLLHKGMGGNPAQNRSTADKMIYLCYAHHQGPRGLDGMYPLSIVPLTDAGTNGPCQFIAYNDTNGPSN